MTHSIILGEFAAILFAVFIALGAAYYADAVKRIGAYNLNALRIILYVIGVFAAYIFLYQSFFPSVNSNQWLYLSLSAVAGLALGDYLFFLSLNYIGPRLSLLVSAPIVPVFAALTGFILIDERLDRFDLIGIAVTLSGIALVLTEKKKGNEAKTFEKKRTIPGIILAFLSSIGQGSALVLAKMGIYSGADLSNPPLNPFATAVVRMLVGALIIWSFVVVRGRAAGVIKSAKVRVGWKPLLLGVGFTLIAGWLSLLSVTYTKTGIAATLQSLMPITIIPIMFFMKGERVTPRAIIGSVIAVSGVAILILL